MMLSYVVADDESKIRLGVKLMIEDLGLAMKCIGEASDGQSLLEFLQVLKPDICFVDIRMPGITGIEAIRKGRTLSRDTKWVIMTGYAEFEYAKEAISLGVEEYLLKPIDEDELIDIYSKIISQLSNKIEINNVQIAERDDLREEMTYFVQRNYNKDISIQMLADHFNISVPYASRMFHEKSGSKFIDYVTSVRMEQAIKIMETQPNLSVKRVSQMVGYSGARHFTKLFLKHTGQYPSMFKKLIKEQKE